MLPLAQRPVGTKALEGLIGLSILVLTVPATAAAQEPAIAQPTLVETYTPSAQASASLPTLPRPKAIRLTPTRTAVRTADGFGLYAAVQGQGVDMTRPTELMNAPNGALFDEAAGLGWRRRNLSAMVGYMRPDGDRPLYVDEGQAYRRPRGRVGFGLSLHY